MADEKKSELREKIFDIVKVSIMLLFMIMNLGLSNLFVLGSCKVSLS